MNELEQECIILNSAWDMINGMVNWAMKVFTSHTLLSRFKDGLKELPGF